MKLRVFLNELNKVSKFGEYFWYSPAPHWGVNTTVVSCHESD